LNWAAVNLFILICNPVLELLEVGIVSSLWKIIRHVTHKFEIRLEYYSTKVDHVP